MHISDFLLHFFQVSYCKLLQKNTTLNLMLYAVKKKYTNLKISAYKLHNKWY